MRTFGKKLVALATLVPLALGATVALGGPRETSAVTSLELAQLPKFCFAEMEVPGAAGPGYSIPKSECGYWANHYCPGLVKLMRFKKAANKSQQLSLLLGADGDVGYTEKGIKDFPQCSIRGHVAATRTEINTLLGIYGKKGSKSPAPAR